MSSHTKVILVLALAIGCHHNKPVKPTPQVFQPYEYRDTNVVVRTTKGRDVQCVFRLLLPKKIPVFLSPPPEADSTGFLACSWAYEKWVSKR
jgi:hypothetical protein